MPSRKGATMKPMSAKEKLFFFFLLSGTILAGSLLFAGNVLALTQPIFNITANPPVIYRGDTAFVTVTPSNFNASSTVFEWRKNGVLDAANSGTGRSEYSFIASAPSTFGITTLTLKLVVKPGGDFADAQQTLPLPIITLPEEGAPGTIPGSGGIPAIETRSIELLVLPSNNPDPGETVTVSVMSSDFDLDRANYRWTVNGTAPKDAQQGVGAKSYTFTAGKTGTSYSVKVAVTPPSGSALSKTAVVRSFDMPMYWWADSVIPLWYRGKALPSIGSEVKITALPNLPGVNPKTLLYSWEFNNNFVGTQSGVGKSVFRFTPQFPVRETIKVRVQNASGSIDKEKTVEIQTFEPLVRAYELKPLEGVEFIRSLTLRAARGGETIDVIAEPFFFPLRNFADLIFQWRINGTDIADAGDHPNILTIQSADDTVRRHSFSVSVENKKDDTQKAQKSFDAEYR